MRKNFRCPSGPWTGVFGLLLTAAGCGAEAGSAASDPSPMSTMPTMPVSMPLAGSGAVAPKSSAAAPSGAASTASTAMSKQPADAAPAASGAAPAVPAVPQSQPATPAAPAANSGASTAMGAAGPTMTSGAVDPAGSTAAQPSSTVQLPVDTGTPTLYWLEIGAGTVTKAAADGSGAKVVASGAPLSAPDGVTVDPEGKHFFVLNMGSVVGGGNSGSLVRYDLDGSNPQVIMKPGAKVGDVTFNTGKQVTIDRVNHKLYLGDREGSKVWRCDYDGANLEVLVSGHGVDQIVGVGADPVARQFYFSDRNGKKLFRASMDMPAGQTHANRDDVELIYVEKVANAMPLDIELDLKNRMIYWTDRRQYKILGMSMDMPAGQTAMDRSDVKTIASDLTEAIGLAFDHEAGVLYVTHSGSVSMVKTDGSGLKRIGSSGSTGIAFAKLP